MKILLVSPKEFYLNGIAQYELTGGIIFFFPFEDPYFPKYGFSIDAINQIEVLNVLYKIERLSWSSFFRFQQNIRTRKSMI